MNVVIPMAGRGSRFSERGVRTPKPLIEVSGRPMVLWALRSVADIPCSRLIFIALAEHEREFGLTALLRSMAGPSPEVVLLEDVTEGQLCTVLAARRWIDTDEDLLIASSDTYIVSDLANDIASRAPDCAGIVSVADLAGDQWSFAAADSEGRVVKVAEKVRISNHASTGLYYFSRGSEFVKFADEIIRKKEKTRGEYYVIPVYQKYIEQGLRIDISSAREMWDMGTPEALASFESEAVAR